MLVRLCCHVQEEARRRQDFGMSGCVRVCVCVCVCALIASWLPNGSGTQKREATIHLADISDIFIAFGPICCLHFGPVSTKKNSVFGPFWGNEEDLRGTKEAKIAPNFGALLGGASFTLKLG